MPTDDELLAEAAAARAEPAPEFVRRRRRMEDFRYDEAQEKYWDITTGVLLGAKSVDGAIPKEWWPTQETASGKLKPYRPSIAINDVGTGLTVEGATWWPGKPQFITNAVITERGEIQQMGAICYNTYVPPTRRPSTGDPQPWIDHVKLLFPDPIEHEHFFDFAAHMIQRPDEKVNHGLVIGGRQGIGKDTMLFPLRRGVGLHNTAEIDPDAVARPYNGHVKSVMLVINEVRPYDEDHRASSFYNQIKPLLASPPEMIEMELKYQNKIYIRNLAHVMLTTNDPLTMYIPEEDRRLFVMSSPLPDPKRNPVFPEAYFAKIYRFLETWGVDSVIDWLEKRDILSFNPGENPPMTVGKRLIIGSAHEIRRTLFDDVFERYVEHFNPEVIFMKDLMEFVACGLWFVDKLGAQKVLASKNVHFKMDERGYDTLRNGDAAEWKAGKYRSRVAFVQKTVPRASQQATVRAALAQRPLAMRFD